MDKTPHLCYDSQEIQGGDPQRDQAPGSYEPSSRQCGDHRQKNAAILGNSESAARNILRSLVKKGYLTEDMSKVPFIYSLEQHLPL